MMNGTPSTTSPMLRTAPSMRPPRSAATIPRPVPMHTETTAAPTPIAKECASHGSSG